MIQIDQLTLLGQGTQKLVYQHPEDSDKVIKLMRPENATADGGRASQHPIRSNRHQGIYRQFRRELLQYLQLCKNNYAQKQFIFPIETVYGFISTDKGLGLVTEKIISPNGESLTLEDVVNQDLFGDEQKKALDQFFDDCCNYHVVFGEKLVIPFRAMSKSINTHNIRKVKEKIKTKLGL